MFKDKNWLIILLAVLIGFAPLLFPFFRGQWARAEYQVFPLLLAGIGYFLWSRWSTATPVDRSHWFPATIGWLSTGGAILLLAMAMFFYSPWLAAVSFVFFSFAIAVNIWLRWDVQGIFAIWLLTCLLVPPPLDRDRMFIAKLQLFSSSFSSRILDGLGILHHVRGNVFDLSKKTLFVDEACSGIVSLVSILTCIAVYVVWQRRSLFHFFLLVAFGLAWVVFMNTIRLVTIAIAWEKGGVDLSSGQPHMLLGLAMFAISAGVVYCVDRLLVELLAPIDVEWKERDASSDRTGLGLMKFWNAYLASPREGEEFIDRSVQASIPKSTPEKSWTKFLSPVSSVGMPVLGLLTLMGIAQLAVVAPSAASLRTAIEGSKKRAISMDQTFVPIKGADFNLELVKFTPESREKFDAWGEFSKSFEYKDEEGNIYWVSVDFPFGPHWHDLRDCYLGSGWKITEEKFFPMAVTLDESAVPRLGTSSKSAGWEADEFVTVRKNPETQPETLHVIKSAFYADGKIFNRPRGGSLFYDFVTHVAKGRDRQEQADYFQIQVVARSTQRVTELQQERARKLIGIVSQNFRDFIAEK